MSGHLNFEQLSDLFDDEVSDNERKIFTAHISDCSACRKEYESLCMCLSLLKNSKSNCGCIDDICHDTIECYKARIRKRQYMKAVPAIAASVLIVAGAGFLRTDLVMAEKTYFSAQVNTENDLQRIINSIRDSKGNILNITGEYVEGEIPMAEIARLESVLHYFRIKHNIIANTSTSRLAGRAAELEDVSFNTGNLAGASMFGRGNRLLGNNTDNEKVRLRIFK